MSDIPEIATTKPSRWMIWLPLALFAGFIALVTVGLFRPAPREVASTLIDKPMPEFDLPPGLPNRPGLASADLKGGEPHLVNIFASWCLPCRVEAPQLERLAQMGVPVQGISVRDRTADLQEFLSRYGDPFQRIGADDDGQVQLALGSSGVPETYVIDGKGTIRYQHIGEIRPEHIPLILGKLEEARR
jgi:cytochrome c biogenesis protein CcmG, thiol:disulfide interchange protein DsbE